MNFVSCLVGVGGLRLLTYNRFYFIDSTKQKALFTGTVFLSKVEKERGKKKVAIFLIYFVLGVSLKLCC